VQIFSVRKKSREEKLKNNGAAIFHCEHYLKPIFSQRKPRCLQFR